MRILSADDANIVHILIPVCVSMLNTLLLFRVTCSISFFAFGRNVSIFRCSGTVFRYQCVFVTNGWECARKSWWDVLKFGENIDPFLCTYYDLCLAKLDKYNIYINFTIVFPWYCFTWFCSSVKVFLLNCENAGRSKRFWRNYLIFTPVK